MSERTRFDLHKTLTDQIVAAIERVSATDFRLPWHRSGMSSIQPKNALTKNAYRGINIVSLWVAAEVHSYPLRCGRASAMGRTRRASAQGRTLSLVIFFKEYETEPDPKDEDDDGKRRVARHSSVFNVAQVDNFTLPRHSRNVDCGAQPGGRRVLRRPKLTSATAASELSIAHRGPHSNARRAVVPRVKYGTAKEAIIACSVTS